MDTKTASTLLKSKTTTASAPSLVPESEIATRAYEIFLSRGASDGHALDDWLQAERELTAGIAGTSKARAASA